MANRLVDLVIRARDGASDVLRRIGGALGGLRSQAGNAAQGAQNIGDAMFGAIMKANLLGFALSKVGDAAGFMMGKFNEAKGLELKLVATAAGFAAVSGKSFADSTKFVEGFNVEIAKIAGALPGATKDYNAVANSILDKLVPAYKGLDGSLNEAGLKTDLIDITKQMTLLGIQTATNSQSTAMFTSRFIAGTESLQSLRILEFGTNNPTFLEEVKKKLKEQGKSEKDFKKLTVQQRAELIKTVSAKFITNEVLDAASNTVDGLTEAIKSNLFDPTTGVFGLLRDLTDDPGNQSVMTAVANGIKSLTNKEKTGFIDQLGNLFTAIGFPSIDPMLILYNGINNISAFIRGAADIVGRMTGVAANQGGILQGLEALTKKYLSIDFLLPKFQSLFKDIATFLQPIFDKYLNIENVQSLISGAASGLSNIFGGLAAKMPSIINGFVEYVVPSIDKYLNIGIDSVQALISGAASGLSNIFGVVSAKLPSIISSLVSFVAPFVEKYLNPTFLLAQTQKLFDSIGGLINSFFASTASLSSNLLGENGYKIAGAFAYFGYQAGSFAIGLMGQLGHFVLALPWADIFVTIGNVAIVAIASLGAGLAGLFVGGFNSFMANIVPLIGQFLGQVWQGITMIWNGLGIVIEETVKPAIPLLGAKASGFFNWIIEELQKFWEGLKTYVVTGLEGLRQQAVSTVTAPVQGAANFVQGVVSDPLGAAANTASSAMNAVGNFFNPPAYTGRVPTASGGLMGAFITESQNMPSGATPVVANSSEWILTPDQLQRIMFNSANVGASQAPSSISVGDIHIHGIPNPAAIADAVIAEIEARLNNYQQSVLA